MIYFTSDLHFGHESILRIRPMFECIEEMNEALIQNWNGTVHAKDFVIITGDLFFRNKTPARDVLSRLKGRKILVRGNHDGYWFREFDDGQLAQFFEGVHEMYGMKREGTKLRFCHFPMVSWESSRRGSILICGHIHGVSQGYEYDMFRQIPCALNAGADVNGLRPVLFSELVANNDAFYKRERTPEERQILNEAARVFG